MAFVAGFAADFAADFAAGFAAAFDGLFGGAFGFEAGALAFKKERKCVCVILVITEQGEVYRSVCIDIY